MSARVSRSSRACRDRTPPSLVTWRVRLSSSVLSAPSARAASSSSAAPAKRRLTCPPGTSCFSSAEVLLGHEVEATLVQDGDPVGQLVGLLQVLGGEEDRDAVLADQVTDDLPHRAPAARVEARPVVGSSRKMIRGRPTSVMARSSLRRMPPEYGGQRLVSRTVVKSNFSEELGRPLPRFALSEVVQFSYQHQVLEAGQQSVNGDRLPGHADRGPHCVRLAGQLVPSDPGLARVRLAQRAQDAHRGRLPGPVRAEQREDRALGDVQVDVVEYELVVK